MRKSPFFAAAALLAISPLLAQDAPQLPGQVDVTRATAGVYATDPAHSLVGFRVNHFGFNDYFGIFGDVSGQLTIDPKEPEKAQVNITIPLDRITTAHGKLTAHMKSKDFFEAEVHPTVNFVSTKVIVDGTNATIEGNLTIKGVTKPIVLDATFTGAGANPFSKKETLGFEATTVVKRSEFGMNYALPIVSDDVELDITVAFEKQ